MLVVKLAGVLKRLSVGQFYHQHVDHKAPVATASEKNLACDIHFHAFEMSHVDFYNSCQFCAIILDYICKPGT